MQFGSPKRLLPTVCLVGALASVLMFGMLCYGFSGYFRLSRDVKALRNGLMETASAEWDRKIEVNIGSWTFGLAQTGLGFLDLKDEALAALRALRSGEVGYYRLRRGQAPLDCGAILKATDEAMAARGWDRLVGVADRHELVAVFVPRAMHSMREVRVCLVVVHGRDVVVASARADLEPLAELALNRAKPRLRLGLTGENFNARRDG